MTETEHVWSGKHLLACRHVIGRGVRNYNMRCDVIGETDSGSIKIRVYGERNWKGREHLSRIRYVSKNRIGVAKSFVERGEVEG